MLRNALTAALVATPALLFACSAAPTPTDPPEKTATIRLQRHGLTAEFNPAIDRLTSFATTDGHNLLHVSDLERDIPADGSYTFWGGAYTWVAPQKGAAGDSFGWLDADRTTKKDWPPDPVMDIGPVRCTSRSPGDFTVIGPDQRTGLREEKTFRLVAPGRAEFEYRLHHRGLNPVSAGVWITTAASLDDVIAVRMPAGAELWGWDQACVDKFKSITDAPTTHGWRLVHLSRADWDGGIKIYLAPPPGQPLRNVEIAIWRANAKAWLHRSLGPMTADAITALRAAGEGPVAVYIQPNDGKDPIVEAELYGSIEHFEPDSISTHTETWRAIPAKSPDPALFP